ncbi:MAG: acyl-CoA reductase [Polyangiales bacterium]
MTDVSSVIRGRAAAVREAGAVLRAASVDERAYWLVRAVEQLELDAHRARSALSDATGLSVPMVQWAIRTTLDTIGADSMRGLVRQAQGQSRHAVDPIRLLAVIVAGNVFTASARGIVVPLLFGVPVLVKASSKETMFPAMVRDALRAADASLGAAMDLAVFPGGDVEREEALTESADAVSVYGTDETITAMAPRLGDTPLIAHGHGVSVAYCGVAGLEHAQIDQTIAALSLDISAYDQRGCLSPQIVYVQDTPSRSAADFGKRLADEGLGPLSRTLPRGPLPMAVGVAQAQWRGVAEVEGIVVRGDSYAVAIRPARPVRWSPAYRNVSLAPVRSLDEALREMESFGSSLKCVGADPASLADVRARLVANDTLQAYACAIGEMQKPPLDAPADGRPVWEGLFRS